jgi:hypothetical protein
MRGSRIAQLGCLAVTGVLAGCDNRCEAVEYLTDGAVDTTAIAKTEGNCTVNVFWAADTVGPKVPK